MSRRDDDLDDEIRQHLRMAAEDRGEESARREFGNVALIKEVTREMWGWTSLERFAQDLRYAFRGMRRSPAFTLTAVLSLALGIGANTAIFTLIDALLLRSLPVHDPQRLIQVIIYQNGKPSDSFSYPVVRALADQKELFSALAGFSGARFNIGSADSVERTPGAWVSGEYYQMLGLQPVLGRLIAPADDKAGATPVAVITDDYWRRRFARDPHVVGRTILIENVPVTLVGVSPPGFSGANVGEVAEITLPLSSNTQLFPEMTGRLTAGPQWLRILARPRPGLSMCRRESAHATPDTQSAAHVYSGRDTRLHRLDPSSQSIPAPAADPDGVGRDGVAHRLRQRGESTARSRASPAARNRDSPSRRRVPRTRDPTIADRKCAARVHRGDGRLCFRRVHK
jgi:hypothetical protein